MAWEGEELLAGVWISKGRTLIVFVGIYITILLDLNIFTINPFSRKVGFETDMARPALGRKCSP